MDKSAFEEAYKEIERRAANIVFEIRDNEFGEVTESELLSAIMRGNF